MKGIYLISNQINGHRYIGMSKNIERRFAEHKCPKSLKKTTVLAKAFRKYGIENFGFYPIEIHYVDVTLSDREKYWIKKFKPEYNMNEGGIGNKGYSVTDKTKDLLRLAGKLQWERLSYQEKQIRITNNLKGRRVGYIMSEESKNIIRIKNTGRKQSDITKEKRSIKNKVSCLTNRNGCKVVSSTLKDGTIIKTFNSIIEAGEYYGINPHQITVVLRGKRNKTHNLYWKYNN